MADKQLIIVVEGTSSMGPHWKTIVSDYLEKIIRAFCTNSTADDKTVEKSAASPASDSTFELALVVFNTRGPYSAFLVRRSSWTRDVDSFIGWLSNLSLSGGGWEDVATTEGLAEALMMFAIPQNGYQAQQNVDGKRHCVLVSTSNPYPLPTLVYRPKIENPEQEENDESQTNNYIYDAETVAEWFGQCSVSLSVISPRQLPKLRAIYNAAKCSQKTSEPTVYVKQPHYLVLVSDIFVEACAALRQSSTPPGPEPSTGNAPQSDIKKEQKTETSIKSGPAQPRYVSSSATSSHASSPPVSQENITKNESVSEIKTPTVSNPQSLQLATTSTSRAQGMPQQAQGAQSVGKNGSASQMPASQRGPTSLPSRQPKYTRVWEGSLCVMKQGQPILITKMEGFRNVKVSETIAADWPRVMHVARVVSQDHMNTNQYVGKADFLVFRAMNQHVFLSQLQEKQLCAVVQLPSQTLLLSMSDKACRLIGMLFPEVSLSYLFQ
ncbi:hypothetical protein RND81_05G122700 [Saponaria officinalis]|uniref:Mediator of RNA polymerase II transcription subunit 25 n=1 Tax=Saponaria officinalis TaxID=3572 RepID=A0AAW1KS56_SAPOF